MNYLCIQNHLETRLVKYNNLNILSPNTKMNSIHLSNIQKVNRGYIRDHIRFVLYFFNHIKNLFNKCMSF